MATRKKASHKKSGRKKASRGTRRGIGAALGRMELPPTLSAFARQVAPRLDALERELARASVDVRRRAARLLREASQQLGRLEAKGEAGWRRLAAPYRRQLVDLLRRLERALAPARPRTRSAARKATGRVTKAMRETAAAIEPTPD
ncbi:MAG: hypothetical protein OZ948_18125 [Deltaproteobacteria bacterium]|nr:hypothetical protein [Deltaproteobacteria bacterium]